jgi:hypothetical protein
MSDDPVLKGSLIGQDYVKIVLLALIVAGFLLTSLLGPEGNFLLRWFRPGGQGG